MKRIKNTLAAVLLTALCSGHAFADGTFNINAGTGTGNGYTWSSPTLTITANGTYIINGSGIATANRIMVNSNLTNVNIILNNVNINVSGCAFDMSGAKVNLILSGTNTLKSGSGAGLRVPFGAELVINKETDDVTDKLTATGGGGGAGIGCSSGDNGGKITIKGGTVTAKGGSNGAGIGSGEYAGAPGSNSGIIIIDGGIITATGGSYSAGIGGGRNGLTVNIAINGGHVTATSAYGGAGIGGGDIGAISDLDDNSAINIKITGGTVTANGGGYGAGIGGGLEGSGGNITISGGSVNATGGSSGAGIGGGGYYSDGIGGSGGNITISGGSVNATGGSSGAGIGGGGYYQTSIGGSGGNITISGGTVTATAGNNGAAIGGGSNNIDNGTVKITGGSVKMNNHDGPQPQNGANVSVYLNTLTIAPAIGDEVAVTASNIPGGYGLTDVKTRDGSKVYFYLPETIGDEKLQLKANNINYKNTYQRQANNGNNKILYEHDLVVSGGTPGTDYQWVNNVLTFKQAGSMYTVTMSGATVPTTTERITVNNDSGDTYNITLDGVSIDVSATSGACAFDMTGAKVKLTLTGTNTLTSGDNSAGLQAPDGATLEITEASLGTLTATGGTLGAGIGGGDHGKGGNIAINGGTVTANGGYGGAAIGGGDFGAGGNITISGGAVTANGGSWGAAIGGGGGSNGGSVGGNITISGGTVTATSGGYGAGIGGGDRSAGGDITISGGTVEANGGSGGAGSGGAGIGGGEGGAGGTVTITGGSVKMNNHDGPQPKNSIGSTGANVYLNTLTIGDPAVGNNVAVTAGNINFVACDPTPNAANGVYGIKDVKTDADGKVYFYLPVTATTETEPTALIAGSNNYSEEFIHSATNHSDEATLTVKNYGVALNHAEQSPTPYTFAALGYGAVPTALTVKALNMGNTAATFNIELSGTNKDFFTLSAVSMGSVSPAEMGEFTVVPNTGLEIGTYTATVTVSIDGQDASYNKTFDVSFKVEKKNITVTGGTITTKTYDGTTDVTVTGVSFSGLENSDTLVIDTDYEITSAAFTDANAGSANRIVEMTVALKSTAKTNNYNLTNGTNYQLTGQTIAKATLTPDDLIIDPDTFARYTDEPQGIDLPTLKPPRTGLGAVTVKYDGSPWPPIYPGTYVITLDITEGENYDAVTDLPVGTYIIIEPPTPSLPRRVTLNVSSHFASDPQPGVFVVSDRKLVITLTPLPTLPAGYEPKVTTNRSPYPNDTGGVKITRNDDGTWTVHIAYILEGMEVIAEAVDPISANGDISASARVWSHGSWLYVAAGANDGRAYIYNISGVLVKTLPYTAGETVFTTLPAGIYVIAADGRQYKVAVKN